MSEYASGFTFGRRCMMDKERIKHALKGELVIGEDENGFIYGKASRVECEQYILSAYDNAVYHAKEGFDAGRALERLMESKGLKMGETFTLAEYMRFREEAKAEFNDYEYEDDEETEE